MRITKTLIAFATAALLASTSYVVAQDEKADPEAPPGEAQNFGPRKKAPKVDGKPQVPPAETISTHGKWQVQCSTIPGPEGQPDAKSCGMIQQAKSEKNDRIGISVIVRKVKAGDRTAVFMQVMAPIGVFLPTGVPIEIDGNALPKPMIFSRCIPPICEATGEASPDSLAKFKKGNNATFYLYDRPGNGFPLKVSLEGFGAALQALDKL